MSEEIKSQDELEFEAIRSTIRQELRRQHQEGGQQYSIPNSLLHGYQDLMEE